MIIGVAVVLIALVVLVAVLGQRARRKRQQAYAAWAASRGYAYTPRDDRYSTMPWGSPFGIGHGRSALDVVTGTYNARPMLCFTYLYRTTQSNGNSTTTQSHYYAVASVRLPRVLPELRVGRENMFTNLARRIGIHDIEFESEDFNRAFRVRSDDRRLAYDVVNPQLMQYLLAGSAPGFSIIGSDLFLIDRGRLRMDDIDARLAYLDAVANGIPSFVWDVR